MLTKRMKILIAYDGSPCADSALVDLRRAGLPPEAEALVFSVEESSLLPPPPPSSYEVVEGVFGGRTVALGQRPRVITANAEVLATLAAGRIREEFPTWEVRAEAAEGSPGKEIIKKASAWDTDLVVVGSHGRSALARFVLGSVSQKVVTEARSSVRVARADAVTDRKSARVLIGVDGSVASLDAVRKVASRAWPASSEALVVAAEDAYAQSLRGKLTPQLAASLDRWNQRAREMLDHAVADLQLAGMAARFAVIVGDPKRVLIEEAANWGADSIFVGSVGLGSRLERFLLGNVSAAVAADATCTVEVVRVKKAHG